MPVTEKCSKKLVSWIGKTDLLILKEQAMPQERNLGPVDTLLESGLFSEAHLLFTSGSPQRKDEVECFRRSMEKRHPKVRIYISDAGNIDPTEMGVVNDATDTLLREMLSKISANARICVNITSGTTAMSISMYHLGWKHDAEVYSTVDPKKAAPGSRLFRLEMHPYAAGMAFEQVAENELSNESPPCGLSKRDYKDLREKISGNDCSILITGETGTGKSFLAEKIHQWSGRKGKCITVNCAGVSDDINSLQSELFGHIKGAFTGADKMREGAFKAAGSGTIFLDEITEMPFRVQGALLRVLQENKFKPMGSDAEYDVSARIIAASNRDIIKEVREGRFRADLYYRLAEYPVPLMALRDRPLAECAALLRYYIAKQRKSLDFDRDISEEAQNLLLEYHWPGNVRQLAYTIKRLCLLWEGKKLPADLVRDELKKPVPEQPMPEPVVGQATTGGTDILPGTNLRAVLESFYAAGVNSPIPAEGFDLDVELKQFRRFCVQKAYGQTRTEKEAAALLKIRQHTMRSWHITRD